MVPEPCTGKGAVQATSKLNWMPVLRWFENVHWPLAPASVSAFSGFAACSGVMQRWLTIGPGFGAIAPRPSACTLTVNSHMPGSMSPAAQAYPTVKRRRKSALRISVLVEVACHPVQHRLAPEQLEHRVDRRRLLPSGDDAPQ